MVDFDSVGEHLLVEETGGCWVILGQQRILPVEHDDLCAKSGETLSKFAANGTCADHEQALRLLSQVEYVLGRVVLDLVDAFDLRNVGTGSCCYACAEELNGLSVDLYCVASRELGVPKEYVQAVVVLEFGC